MSLVSLPLVKARESHGMFFTRQCNIYAKWKYSMWNPTNVLIWVTKLWSDKLPCECGKTERGFELFNMYPVTSG